MLEYENKSSTEPKFIFKNLENQVLVVREENYYYKELLQFIGSKSITTLYEILNFSNEESFL